MFTLQKRFIFSFLSLFCFAACLFTTQNRIVDVYKTIIIGDGIAGNTAGIYLSRSNLETLIVTGDQSLGQLAQTPDVGNWPGEISISGYDLVDKIHKHAEHFGCNFLSDTVVKVDFSCKPYKIFTKGGKTLKAESIVVATGASPKKLRCVGEKEYKGKGVSFCATCDAPFYRNKDVFVIGGGNVALLESYHLASFAKQVTIVHTSPKFHVSDPIKDIVLKNSKIKVIHNSFVKKIIGDNKKVTAIVIENKNDHNVSTIKTDGVFVAIGFVPNSQIFKDQIELDKAGYIVLKNDQQTNKEGVFAAGDVANPKFKQAIVAAGDGCRAALACINYLTYKK